MIRIATLALFALAGGIMLYLLVRKTTSPNVLDDALMFYRYAHNILHGGQIGFNAGERSYGCTSLTYLGWVTLLLSVSGQMIRPETLTAFASVSMGLLSIVTLYFALRLAQPDTALRPIRWVFTGFTVLAPTYILQWETGMDTTAAITANAGLIALCLASKSWTPTRRLAALWLGAWLVFLTRPDSGLYAVGTPFIFLLTYARRRDAWIFALGMFLILALDTAGKYAYFGTAAPLPFYAKSGAFYQAYMGLNQWDLSAYYGSFAWQFGLLPVMAALLAPEKAPLKLWAPWIIPALPTLFYLAGFVQIMGFNARFLAPSAPFFVVAAYQMISNAPSEAVRRMQTGLLALAGFAMCSMSLHFYQNRRVRQEIIEAEALVSTPDEGCFDSKKELIAPFQQLDNLLGRLPDTTTIALTEHGYPGAAHLKTYIIDLCGLHHAGIALGGSVDQALQARPPALIWVHPHYWGVRHQLEESEWVRAHYLCRSDLLPGGVWERRR